MLKSNGDDSDNYFVVNGDGSSFELIADVSRSDDFDSLSVVFSYNNDYDLSKHIIDRITIEYENKES